MVDSIPPMFDLCVAKSARCCRGNAVMSSLDTIPSLDTTVSSQAFPLELEIQDQIFILAGTFGGLLLLLAIILMVLALKMAK